MPVCSKTTVEKSEEKRRQEKSWLDTKGTNLGDRTISTKRSEQSSNLACFAGVKELWKNSSFCTYGTRLLTTLWINTTTTTTTMTTTKLLLIVVVVVEVPAAAATTVVVVVVVADPIVSLRG